MNLTENSSASGAHNLGRMHVYFIFLSHIVYGFVFSGCSVGIISAYVACNICQVSQNSNGSLTCMEMRSWGVN